MTACQSASDCDDLIPAFASAPPLSSWLAVRTNVSRRFINNCQPAERAPDQARRYLLAIVHPVATAIGRVTTTKRRLPDDAFGSAIAATMPLLLRATASRNVHGRLGDKRPLAEALTDIQDDDLWHRPYTARAESAGKSTARGFHSHRRCSLIQRLRASTSGRSCLPWLPGNVTTHAFAGSSPSTPDPGVSARASR